ncbi:MAG TPA: hypothetical protein VLF89_06360 [Candidatus Saccharimonadales bacterium]|nr:hypothetical protein [Candidatus Saccharimonadales bacterium]
MKHGEKGQTLVTLLFFMVIAITITTGAIIIIFVNTQAQTKIQQSQSAYYVAESGMENALIQSLRNPSYTGEITLIGEGSASISATLNGSVQAGTFIATSAGTVGNFVRKIQVIGIFTNNVFTVQSWKEIF